jgi:hypothetical protein
VNKPFLSALTESETFKLMLISARRFPVEFEKNRNLWKITEFAFNLKLEISTSIEDEEGLKAMLYWDLL